MKHMGSAFCMWYRDVIINNFIFIEASYIDLRHLIKIHWTTIILISKIWALSQLLYIRYERGPLIAKSGHLSKERSGELQISL